MDRKKRKRNRFTTIVIHFFVIVLIVLVAAFLFFRFVLGRDILKLPSFPKFQKSEAEVEPILEDPQAEIAEQEGIGEYQKSFIVLDAIVKSMEKLDIIVDENLVITRSQENENLFNIGVFIDEQSMDITFANLVLKGAIQSVGGKILKSVESEKGISSSIEATSQDEKNTFLIQIGYQKSGSSLAKSRNLLAVVVDDFGNYGGELLTQFAQADRRINFAIIPQLEHSTKVMELASKSGHQSLIHIPMEPMGYPANDPGDNAIFVELKSGEIRKRMREYISQLDKAIGANNHMGSLATQDRRVMGEVLNALKEENLFFVDSKTTSKSIASKVASELQIPNFERDLFLDVPDESKKTIEQKLELLRKWKATKPRVLAITHSSSKQRLDNLLYFIAEAEEIGYELVSISDFFKFDTAY